MQRQTLSSREVRDVSDAAPRERVVAKAGFGSVLGYSIAITGVPTQVRISRPRSAPEACVALFALTQANAAGERYTMVDLSTVANANHAIDFFLPDVRANYFPDLEPGILHARGHAFAVLAQGPGITAGTTLTTSGQPGYAQRLPLFAAPTASLLLLIDGRWLPPAGEPVAYVTVEYTTGPPTRAPVLAGAHVRDYDEPAAEPVAW